MSSSNQFSLLKERRFAPFFFTQLLGAFNDNLYKNGLVALISFVAIQGSSQSTGLMINLAAGLFILPFFLFSAISGQIADKYEKSMLIRRIKFAEIIIMLLGAVAFIIGSHMMLIGILFLMGTQSAFFGPIKYGILPQHLHESELIGGNGVVELGTFLAILMGTIVGTQLITKAPDGSVMIVCVFIVAVAITGYLTSRRIPTAAAVDPTLTIRFNPFTETWKLVSYTRKNRIIFQCILGISWFWFMGATYLAQFPVYARDVIGGNGDVYTLMLAAFSIGIGIGSSLCEKLSGSQVEIGLVPFGAIGLTLFGIDLVLSTPDVPLGVGLGAGSFFAATGSVRILFDILFIGLFGGFYIVPLYALIQKTSAPERLSRAIACNNVMNALFMVLSALVAGVMLALQFSIAQMFLTMAIMNALVAAYIFRLVPEFLMRFIVWLLIHTLYRVRVVNAERVPEKGACIVVANHVSFVDSLIIAGCIRRPLRFVVYYKIYNLPVLNFVFRTAGAIPIAAYSEDEKMYQDAFVEMRKALEQGQALCIFPEGGLTDDGDLKEFKPGILRVLEATPVPVIPMALQGLWGSLFSRYGGKAFFKLPRRAFAKINLVVGEPITAEEVTLPHLRDTVAQLRGDQNK